MKAVKGIIFLFALVLISACSSLTTMSSPQPGTTLLLKDRTLTLPSNQRMKGTSFGNYAFKAVDGDAQPMYGILPLKLNGGHLAVDIVLFAPAAFFNLRQVFAFYDIDVANGVIRYKNAQGDPWIEYKPKPEEAEHARTQLAGDAKSASTATH